MGIRTAKLMKGYSEKKSAEQQSEINLLVRFRHKNPKIKIFVMKKLNEALCSFESIEKPQIFDYSDLEKERKEKITRLHNWLKNSYANRPNPQTPDDPEIADCLKLIGELQEK